MHTLLTRRGVRRALRTAYVLLTTASAFVLTAAPAIIKADVEPIAFSASGAGTGSGTGSAMTAIASGAATGSTAQVSAALVEASSAPVTLHMRITAYSSTPDQTDSTPFITASGEHVRDGIVASNILPFGTKVMIPSLFGSKVFTVEDRMSPRIKNTIDIWMASTASAIRFGENFADVVILGAGTVALRDASAR